MRWLLVLIGLWGACLFSPSVLGHGLYVLPYELRVRALRSPQRRLRPAERFSVLVLLSDHHSKSYAEPDGLDQFLPGNYFPDGALFLDDYLKILHAWYLRQMNRLEHYYGPKVAEITGMLQALEPLKDGHSSAVVITRFGKFDEPLAMFRVTVEDAAGLLSSERHFLHLGLEGEPFPRVVAEERLMEVPHLKNVSYGPKTFQFAYPAPSRFSLGWVGANIEAKNYAMDPYTYRRFFPHLFHIAWTHRMFTVGGRAVPKEILGDAHTPFGWRAGRVWCDCYGDVLRGLYEGMGFQFWRKIKNHHTFGQELNFLYGDVDVLRARVEAQIDAFFPGRADHDSMVFDTPMAVAFRGAKCLSEFLAAAQRVAAVRAM